MGASVHRTSMESWKSFALRSHAKILENEHSHEYVKLSYLKILDECIALIYHILRHELKLGGIKLVYIIVLDVECFIDKFANHVGFYILCLAIEKHSVKMKLFIVVFGIEIQFFQFVVVLHKFDESFVLKAIYEFANVLSSLLQFAFG